MSRIPEYSVEPIFPQRWSRRAMSGEPITQAELNTLFEAARWAPSCFNSQPWRFLYARRDTPAFVSFLELLGEGNRVWCVRAAVLVVVVSKTTFDNGQASPTPSYDAGAAWMSLALQAELRGLAARGMAGFDYELARSKLEIPPDHKVEAMIAIGRRDQPEDLLEQIRLKEVPSGRHPTAAFAFEGGFPKRG